MGLLVDGHWQEQEYDTRNTGGCFLRQESTFRNWVTPDGRPGPNGEGVAACKGNRYGLAPYGNDRSKKCAS